MEEERHEARRNKVVCLGKEAEATNKIDNVSIRFRRQRKKFFKEW